MTTKWSIRFTTEDGRHIRHYVTYQTKRKAAEVAQAWLALGKVSDKTTIVSYEVCKEEW